MTTITRYVVTDPDDCQATEEYDTATEAIDKADELAADGLVYTVEEITYTRVYSTTFYRTGE